MATVLHVPAGSIGYSLKLLQLTCIVRGMSGLLLLQKQTRSIGVQERHNEMHGRSISQQANPEGIRENSKGISLLIPSPLFFYSFHETVGKY